MKKKNRIAVIIETDNLCTYGCGNKARYINGSGNLMCESSYQKCPAVRKKNSDKVTLAHKEGRIPGFEVLHDQGKSNNNWAAGLTRYDDPRITAKYNPETLFTIGGKGPHKKILIIERGHKCETCNNSVWLDKPITLELEHIDGDDKNNQRENLKLLCPNCHSQTPTWRRRKDTTKNGRIHSEEICIKVIKQSKSMNDCLTKLGLKSGSGPSIKKIMNKHGLSFKKKYARVRK